MVEPLDYAESVWHVKITEEIPISVSEWEALEAPLIGEIESGDADGCITTPLSGWRKIDRSPQWKDPWVGRDNLIAKIEATTWLEACLGT